VRVIAGTLKGHKLDAPRGLDTRPTAARVREALFSMLGDVQGDNVLDLYAGSGALGIEALSRGARAATFVESSRAALTCLRANLGGLDLEQRGRVVPLRAERCASALAASGPFDLVFCDPPWGEVEEALSVLVHLSKGEILTRTARVFLEHAARDPLPPLNDGPLAISGSRSWGDTAVTSLILVKKPTSS
jgi:16S rRNA (guanine966-N2)-methyltransferase